MLFIDCQRPAENVGIVDNVDIGATLMCRNEFVNGTWIVAYTKRYMTLDRGWQWQPSWWCAVVMLTSPLSAIVNHATPKPEVPVSRNIIRGVRQIVWLASFLILKSESAAACTINGKAADDSAFGAEKATGSGWLWNHQACQQWGLWVRSVCLII